MLFSTKKTTQLQLIKSFSDDYRNVILIQNLTSKLSWLTQKSFKTRLYLAVLNVIFKQRDNIIANWLSVICYVLVTMT